MHNHHESNQTAGNLKISREVIATIARYAALEIEGIDSLASFTSNIKGWLLKKQSARPILIELNDDLAIIDIHVNVKASSAEYDRDCGFAGQYQHCRHHLR